MRAVDVIRRKRDAEELTPAEVESFVRTDRPGEFRRRRSDGVLGESLVFRTDAQGNVTALVHEDNVIRRAAAQ